MNIQNLEQAKEYIAKLEKTLVIAVMPLEAMNMAGQHNTGLCNETWQAVQTAINIIRSILLQNTLERNK